MEFEDYVAQRRKALCRFAGVLCGDPRLADELVADTLGNAFERWDKVSRTDNLHAYVRRMLLNEYLSWRRRAARMAVRPDVTDLVAPVADHADAHAEQQQLLVELRLLPDKQRAAVVLRYYEGLSYAEIADLLGGSEITARSNVSRALRRLRVQLTDEPGGSTFPVPRSVLEARP